MFYFHHNPMLGNCTTTYLAEEVQQILVETQFGGMDPDRMTETSEENELRLVNLVGFMESNGVAEDVVKYSTMVEQQKRFVYGIYKQTAALAQNPLSYAAWCVQQVQQFAFLSPQTVAGRQARYQAYALERGSRVR